MTGSQLSNLHRRNGTYYLRVRVPDCVRERVGLSEVRRSLRSNSLKTAKPIALKYAARILGVFDMAQAGHLSKDKCRHVLQAIFHDLSAEVDGVVARSNYVDAERDFQDFAWSEAARDIREQLDTNVFSDPVVCVAKTRSVEHGIVWDALNSSEKLILLHGVGRAMLEQHRVFQFRQTDLVGGYHPQDELFRTGVELSQPLAGAVQIVDASAPTVSSQPLGPTVLTVVERYLAKGKVDWTPKTYKSRSIRLTYLLDFMGRDKPFAGIPGSPRP